MQCSGSVRVDVVAGTGPGQLQAVVNFVGDDGTVHESSDHIVLSAGNSLQFGPLLLEYTSAASVGHEKTPEPTKKPTTIGGGTGTPAKPGTAGNPAKR